MGRRFIIAGSFALVGAAAATISWAMVDGGQTRTPPASTRSARPGMEPAGLPVPTDRPLLLGVESTIEEAEAKAGYYV
jgi:hypothetical protein